MLTGLPGGRPWAGCPNVGYKHVRKGDLSAKFERGSSIRVGTLSYYRAMEGQRGDRFEGVAEYVIGNLEPSDGVDPKHEAVRKKINTIFRIPWNNPNIAMHHVAFRFVVPHMYIFCLSDRPDPGLRDTHDISNNSHS